MPFGNTKIRSRVIVDPCACGRTSVPLAWREFSRTFALPPAKFAKRGRGTHIDQNWLSVQEALVLAVVLREVQIPQPLANPDTRSTTEQFRQCFPKLTKLTPSLWRSRRLHFMFPSPRAFRICCDSPVLRKAAIYRDAADIHSDALTRLTRCS